MADKNRNLSLLGRRQFLAGAAGALGVAAFGGLSALYGSPSAAASTPKATETVKIALGWIKNVEFAGIWLAEAKGYFQAQGINVDVIAGGPNAPDPTVSVAAGNANIGDSSDMTTLIEAITKGNDFVFIGATFQVDPACIVSLPEHPVRTPKDLVGIKFLGQQGVQTDINAVLKLAHLPVKYDFIPVGYTPEPLVQHQGQAYSAFVTNEVITLEQQGLKAGKDFIITTWTQLGLPSYSDIYFASKKYIDANRDTVVRFMTAVCQGWEENMKLSPDVAAKLAVNTYGTGLGLNMKQQILENEAQIPYIKSAQTAKHGLLWVDEAELGGAMYKALKASGVSNLPPVADIIDTSILSDVYGGKSRIPV
jgi:ABC-type nitrate/sulfonate/bicarbonate transport system substrate-binding protein